MPSRNTLARQGEQRNSTWSTPTKIEIEIPVNDTRQSTISKASAVPRSWDSHRRARSDVASVSSGSRDSSMVGRRGHATSNSSESPAGSPGVTYQERAQRLKEKQEAREIREAMERMKLEKDDKQEDEEEKRIQEAAQREATELVMSHQNVGLPKINPNAPYRNPDLRWTRRFQRRGENGVVRNGTNGSNVSAGAEKATFSHQESARPPIGVADIEQPTLHSPRKETFARNDSGGILSVNKNRGLPRRKSIENTLPWLSRRRKSSARSKRLMSNGSSKKPFGTMKGKSDTDKQPQPRVRFDVADEDGPEKTEPQGDNDPTPTDRSTRPFSLRNRKSIFDLPRIPFPQSRNPQYKTNPPPRPDAPKVGRVEPQPTKDGIEVRSDEIRAATSMRLKDRSPQLPVPTGVSDTPDRPIVSFQSNWKPSPIIETSEADDASTRPAVTISPPRTASSRPSSPNKSSPPQIIEPPSINVSEPPQSTKESSTIPSIAVPAEPTIGEMANATRRPLPRPGQPSIPTIGVSGTEDVPRVSVSGEPSTNGGSYYTATRTTTSRPLPRPLPTEGQPNGTSVREKTRMYDKPATTWRTPYIRTGVPAATCDACHRPIAGRVVTACNCRFHPQCFVCHHCQTPLECVSFYQEPESNKQKRLAETNPRDPDAQLQRFYCHLDFHELFSPRCKSCKTPIEGEVIVACGAQYHVGHFFCAECGDPFSPTTPFVEKDNHAWCVSCHSKRMSPRCLGCKQLVLDEMFVTALGGSWHSKCFNCAECGANVGSGTGFFVKEGPPKMTAKGRQIGGPVKQAVCEDCEKRRLKA
ncbi:hypothetical protein KEM55_002139 [Ascosphaera atra]|nr:hypothetical protein KEM55_002139 [Ascosphaera atra]